MFYKFYLIIICIFCLQLNLGMAQQEITKQQFDSLKRAVVSMNLEVQQINTNLLSAKKTLKTGVFIATLGYTITIIGGQLLGVDPQWGEALLYAGGAIGIGGTIVLVNGFNRIHKVKPYD